MVPGDEFCEWKPRWITLPTDTNSFKDPNQLTSLLDTLSSSAAHFIRCVVPNYERIPGKIDGPLVLNQLRYVLLLSP
ncbi:hypothetical protein ANCDUO_19986 [Ancylostoma duodenale]|uniref:Myosin motor domain-containing protein n=1 Tax=Ancylostoma duodenale TaxID=51022 RepID=A0A0C2C121_9BILA|nr:hypothetical protein ANCDUO_19986 [Ancylostoma duodenale]